VKHNHPTQQLLGNIDEGRRLRSRVIQPTSEVANQVSYSCYLAQTEPKKVDEALQDEGWVSAMHDELHQFTRNYVWTLVPRLPEQNGVITFFPHELSKNAQCPHELPTRPKYSIQLPKATIFPLPSVKGVKTNGQWVMCRFIWGHVGR
jgi:hypothetical protein